MAINEFSKDELIQILKVIEGARNCDTQRQLKGLLMKAKDLVEADNAICGLAKVQGSSVTEVLSIINGNFPQEWMSRYQAERLYFIDPVVKYHTQFSMPQFWDDIFKISNDGQSKMVINHAADHGLKHGISSGIYEPDLESIGIFAFSGGRNRFRGHHKKILDILMLHLNKALIRATCEQEITEEEKSFLEVGRF